MKKPKTFEEQLDILVKDHKLNIDLSDQNKIDEALKVLKEINYYSFRGYGLQYEVLNTNPDEPHKYSETATINSIHNLYLFDTKLKIHIFRLIGIVEKKIRTIVANTLSTQYKNSECQKAYIYKNPTNALRILEKTRLNLFDFYYKQGSKDLTISHHIKKYHGHFPIWVIIESFSFGDLFHFCLALHDTTQNKISQELFEQNFGILKNWFYCMKFVRNICAHFNRLYGKELPRVKLNQSVLKYGITKTNNNELYSFLVILKLMVNDEEHWNHFFENICKLIDLTPEASLDILGLPDDWKTKLK